MVPIVFRRIICRHVWAEFDLKKQKEDVKTDCRFRRWGPEEQQMVMWNTSHDTFSSGTGKRVSLLPGYCNWRAFTWNPSSFSDVVFKVSEVSSVLVDAAGKTTNECRSEWIINWSQTFIKINNNEEGRLLTHRWCFFGSKPLRFQTVHNPLQGFGWLDDLIGPNKSRW